MTSVEMRLGLVTLFSRSVCSFARRLDRVLGLVQSSTKTHCCGRVFQRLQILAIAVLVVARVFCFSVISSDFAIQIGERRLGIDGLASTSLRVPGSNCRS